nr:MAG TPA: Baseplate structural protein [Caudoviricetes sp.]DAP31328.1 MAG TPA: Baseplate structural protein [Caudoviricetes sp.]
MTYNGTSETGYKDSIWVQDVSTKRNSGLSSGSTSTSSASYLNRATTSGNSNMPPYLAVYVWKRTA